MTLIAVAPGDEQAYGAVEALRVLSRHHPARILILRPDPDSVATLDARATLYSIDGRTHFEEVLLTVGGQAALHLDSLVEAFTLSDLPVVVWYVNAIPLAADPLLSVATAVLIDSRDALDVGELRSLLELARRRIVVDLSWVRLSPWRELLAGLFDPPEARVLLEQIRSARVTGKAGPRRLLGGWLAGQLGVGPRQVTLADARHVALQVTAGGDRPATFSVERVEGQRLVAAEAAVPAGPTWRATATLPDDPLPTSLGTALTHLVADPVWERALSQATVLSP